MTLTSLPLDLRLQDAPMHPLTCRDCAATVQVRKASWEQTTVQWDQQSVRGCIERQGFASDGATFRGCHRLSESILAAADSGRLDIVADRAEATGD